MGNAVEMIFPDGNLIEDKHKITTETKKYFYNSENRLIRFEHYPSDIQPADIIAEYKYDLYGRRIQKTVNGTAINFLWDDDNISLELDHNYQPIRRYIYGVGMDNVEGHFEYSESGSNPFGYDHKGWYTYIKDQVGTIYKTFSHETQQITNSKTFDAFGNLINQTGTSEGNLSFQSKYYDQESGLYYFYRRYYDPREGRFINEDPIGLSGGFNMYKFVNNNPNNWIDPFGLDWREDHSGWLTIACKLWKFRSHGASLFESGSWLYSDGSYDIRPEDWWEADFEGRAHPKRPHPGKDVAGSIHTHPSTKNGKRNPNYGPSTEDRSWAKNSKWNNKMPVYVVSYKGIWGYNPLDPQKGDYPIMSYKDFKEWCKCHGLW